jgi:hypothetical protein
MKLVTAQAQGGGGTPGTACLDYAHYAGDGEVATMPGQWQFLTNLQLQTVL